MFVATSPEQRILLYDVRWETYERLLADLENSSAPRLTFDQGVLEIMSPLPEHEESNRTLALLVEVCAEELNIQVRNLGSTTFKREDLKRGFEPDSCFYIQNVERIRGKSRLDLTTDPPPDLVIEIDLTRESLNKFAIYAQLGVPEVWRYDGTTLDILVLEGSAHSRKATSKVLPALTDSALTGFLKDSKSLTRLEWLRKLRTWIRARVH